MKNPNKPYKGKCQGCNKEEWLDVGHTCTICFALMHLEEKQHHMAYIRWVQAGRPESDNPWEK